MELRLVPIVAALFTRRSRGFLEIALFQRRWDDEGAGFWEFPGGKIEVGETPEQALVREVKEELDLDVVVGAFVGTHARDFPNKRLELALYHVQSPHFFWRLNDHDGAQWVTCESWKNLEVAKLDIPLLEQIFKSQK